MTVAVGILKRVPLCIYSHEGEVDKSAFMDRLLSTFASLQQSRLSYDAISFNDPINRLIFETPEGEVASDFEDKVREYFDEQVIFNTTVENVKDWIMELWRHQIFKRK